MVGINVVQSVMMRVKVFEWELQGTNASSSSLASRLGWVFGIICRINVLDCIIIWYSLPPMLSRTALNSLS